MYLADYHTHTQFSPDAHDPMTVMAQAALDAGMDGFIMKPFRVDEMMKVIGEVME